MIELVPVAKLKPHEETEEKNLQRTIEAIEHGALLDEHPILIDRDSFVILDGHHRYNACLALNISEAPCILYDYFSDEVMLESRRDDITVSKDDVIQRGLDGNLYPPKTTRHIFAETLIS